MFGVRHSVAAVGGLFLSRARGVKTTAPVVLHSASSTAWPCQAVPR